MRIPGQEKGRDFRSAKPKVARFRPFLYNWKRWFTGYLSLGCGRILAWSPSATALKAMSLRGVVAKSRTGQ
jgi:hypothetical protein